MIQYFLEVLYLHNVQMSLFGVLKIIKEWNTELEERTGRFRKQANAIAEWDKRILQNRDVLLRLEVESLGIFFSLLIFKDIALGLHLIMYVKLLYS